MSELQITSLEELKRAAAGEVVELPAFGEGMPFVARLRRPSLLVLIKSGKIPNDLLTAANELFTTGGGSMSKTGNKDVLKNTLGVLEAICEASFLEPTWEQLKENGVQLTDNQYLAVFQYSQKGIKALRSFCKKLNDTDGTANVEAVRESAE